MDTRSEDDLIETRDIDLRDLLEIEDLGTCGFRDVLGELLGVLRDSSSVDYSFSHPVISIML